MPVDPTSVLEVMVYSNWRGQRETLVPADRARIRIGSAAMYGMSIATRCEKGADGRDYSIVAIFSYCPGAAWHGGLHAVYVEDSENSSFAY